MLPWPVCSYGRPEWTYANLFKTVSDTRSLMPDFNYGICTGCRHSTGFTILVDTGGLTGPYTDGLNNSPRLWLQPSLLGTWHAVLAVSEFAGPRLSPPGTPEPPPPLPNLTPFPSAPNPTAASCSSTASASPCSDLRCGNVIFFNDLYHVAYQVLLLRPWPSYWSRCACPLTQWPTAWSCWSRYHPPALVLVPALRSSVPVALLLSPSPTQPGESPFWEAFLSGAVAGPSPQVAKWTPSRSSVSRLSRECRPRRLCSTTRWWRSAALQGPAVHPAPLHDSAWQGHLTLASFVEFGGVLRDVHTSALDKLTGRIRPWRCRMS